jgi:hypothetical protein
MRIVSVIILLLLLPGCAKQYTCKKINKHCAIGKQKTMFVNNDNDNKQDDQQKIENQKPKVIMQQKNKKTSNCRKQAGFTKRVFGTLGYDIAMLHRYLITWDSFKVIVAFFPPFIAARMVDEKLQNSFYDHHHHKNRNQLPKWCHGFSAKLIGVPAALIGTQAFLSRDCELATTARMLLVGLPFVTFGKDLIKKMRFQASLRPWHEDYSCEERSGGGFPSGHMAEATYTALLFGMRYGPKYAIPLGLISGAVGITFLTCNRHYLSQLVAGAGLGALYAFAAHKVVDDYMPEDLKLTVAYNKKRGMLTGFSFWF